LKPTAELLLTIESFHELGETIAAANYLLEKYQLQHPFLKEFVLRESAKPNFILLTTEGKFGEPQVIRIPENFFEFDLIMLLNLLVHEMIHVEQKSHLTIFPDKNEREWQAYYEMIFHKVYPQIPEASTYHKKFFANKGLEYYNRMGENSILQLKYASQKKEIDDFLKNLE